ncbi:MAG TPA: hypothetical protein VER11_09135 [Polyangiaceae bacterium]|nr:hypothetical protein [Polyangiaceae bacterium]
MFFALGACGGGVEALYYVRSHVSGLEFETDMRWFVEVSRVGENGVADEYCVEAKQWQAALQEARKLRGDTGALSKFSIELLDRGYRAVDPALKLRYLINEAPPDAPLTGSGETAKRHANKAEHSGGKPRVNDSVAPSVYAASLAPTPFTTSLAPPATSSLVPTASSSPVPRPSHAAPRQSSVVPPAVAISEPPRAPQLVVPADPVPPAPAVPGGLTQPPPPPAVPKFELVRERAEEPRPDSPITYREFAYAVEPGRSRSEIEALLRDRYQATRASIEDRPPGKFVQLAVFDHVFKRRPERPPLATFAWKDWRGEPVLAFPGFGEEPMPPVSRIPPAPASIPPPSNGVPVSAPTSVAPESARVVPIKPVVISSVPAPPAKVVEVAPAPAPAPLIDLEIPIEEAAAPSVDLEIPIEDAAPAPAPSVKLPEPAAASAPESASIPIVEAAPTVAVETAIPIVEGGRAPVVEAPPVAVAASASAAAAESTVSIVEGGRAPVVDVPVSVVEGARAPVVEAPALEAAATAEQAPPAQASAAPSFELTFETPIAPPPTASNPTSAARASRPRIAAEGRRRAGEDLIGELFEIMHDLHFAGDVAEGAEFVLSVLDELLPCEGVLIQVFDINTGHFVVVRAKGPNANRVLMQRMSDQDPLVRSVMRTTHAVSVKNAADDPRFAGPRWQSLGVTPRAALCGGVQLSGRYLGLIEIANPHGDIPFHQSELNALDYICEQFAAFLSKKPIVLSEDVILSRG